MASEVAQSADRPRLGVGLALLVGVVLAVAGFVLLGYLLALTPLYAGFLFLWYWASVAKVDFKALPGILIGALAGTATAWLLQYCDRIYGLTGLYLMLTLITLAVLVQIMNWAPIAINTPYMLFLTVTAAPLLQGGEDFRAVLAVILVGAIYFALFVYLGRRIFLLLLDRRALAES